MTAEGNRVIPEPYKSAYAEVSEMRTLIPPRGIPVAERATVNAIVRQRLSQISDLAVATLMVNGHDLSRREFVLRLREQRVQQIESTFEIMQYIYAIDNRKPEPFTQAFQEAVKCAPYTPVDRMVELLVRYQVSDQEHYRDVFEEVLSVHPEMDHIARLFLERKAGIDWSISWMTTIKKGAGERKLKRQVQSREYSE